MLLTIFYAYNISALDVTGVAWVLDVAKGSVPVHLSNVDLLYVFVRDKKIPWENVVAFNSDNCSVVKGAKKGLIAKIRSKQPNIIDVGCICHLANPAVQSSLKSHFNARSV
jgi:hypothetical protein